MLRIGIDARLLSRPLTGIGRYTLEMCRALCKIENLSLYLYSPSPIDNKIANTLPGARIKTGQWESGILRQIWSESYLPYWAKNDSVDIFWGPTHRLPRFLPKKIPKVVTIHDLVWKYAGDTMYTLSRYLERYQMPKAVGSADHIVADSQATADAIKGEFDVVSESVSVVMLGASLADDAGTIEVLEKKGIIGPYFLFVGTLEPRKNLLRLLIAYSHLSDSIRNQTSLVIAGGKGWGGIELESTVTDLDLESTVKILGYVDDLTLSTLYANARFLAMPSLYEGFGLPLVEAMIHGTPVLTSNNSSMPEVAGNSGLLIDPLDVDSIRKGLEKLLTDESLRKELASNTTAHVLQFNWATSANQLVSTFEQVINEKRKKYL